MGNRSLDETAGNRPDAFRPVDALRFPAPGRTPFTHRSNVIIEQPLTIDVEGVGSFTIMCTPRSVRELAAGFLLSEGMIASLADIHLLEQCEEDASIIRIRIGNPRKASGRTMLVASSCGMCGASGVEEIMKTLGRCGDSLRVSTSLIETVMRTMQSKQELFAQTGGTHAAALFSGEGTVVAFAEDIGRHNAMDKAVGECLLRNVDVKGCGVAVTGRVSFELVVKAARAALEIVAAVSAPTSMAVDAAERAGITLCAFVRAGRATAYTHPERLLL
jgi:FdhD protein